MTGPSGNRQIYLPLEIQDCLPKSELLTSASPWSIETLGEAILNLSGQIDLPITLETSHYLFTNKYLSSNVKIEHVHCCGI